MTALTALAADWTVVKAIANFRIWNRRTRQYRRGCNGAVRVYRDEAPARRRADMLNGKSEVGSRKAELGNGETDAEFLASAVHI